MSVTTTNCSWQRAPARHLVAVMMRKQAAYTAWQHCQGHDSTPTAAKLYTHLRAVMVRRHTAKSSRKASGWMTCKSRTAVCVIIGQQQMPAMSPSAAQASDAILSFNDICCSHCYVQIPEA